jgi:hypothetical protein
VEKVSEGEVALVLVLGLMAELDQSGTLIPEQLNEIMDRALDRLGDGRENAALRRRLQGVRKYWNVDEAQRGPPTRPRRR